MAFQREVAHRLFATEFNQARHAIKAQAEKEASYLLSPTGAKVNRLHVVGVCTDIEHIGESGNVVRARISDPSGVFTVYAGQYQPEAAHQLSQLKPPCYVAVTGKARTYEPEPGSVFVSVRPESVQVVDQATRDQWILTTARRTSARLKAARQGREPTATADSLVAAGHSKADAEGALLAREPYALSDLERFSDAAKNALKGLLPGGEIPVHREVPDPQAPTEAPAWKAPAPAPADDNASAQDALDEKVQAAVQELEGDKGARWDDILQKCAVGGVTSEDVEESLNRLMDKGVVYEPTLGVLKMT